MASTIELALLAGAAYRSTRGDINKIPTPENWTEVPGTYRRTDSTGFEAIAFQKGNEIVISYAGTDPGSISPFSPDMSTNIALARGQWADQLLQAAEYYLQVKAANPLATITLTGHSLGGGLAALISVFFGVTAKTFDQAPFADSALASGSDNNAAELLARLSAKVDSGGNRLYPDAALAALIEYLPLRSGGGTGYIPRSDLVSTIRVEGEFLDGGLFTKSPIGGPPTQLTHGPATWTGASLDLHSQALLASFLLSDQSAQSSANPTQTLRQASVKLVSLMEMLFESKLFKFSTAPSSSDRNLLEHLVRHQAGVQAVAGQSAITADQMVTRFTKDLWKLAQDGGLTLTDGQGGSPATNFLSKTLTAFAMQFYYENSANATNQTKYLFSDVAGGVQFDMADVSKDFATAYTNSTKPDLTKAKGLDYAFNSYLAGSTFTGAERSLIKSMLPYLRDWYVQAGTGGLAITDVLDRGAFMLGGTGSDALVRKPATTNLGAANACNVCLERRIFIKTRPSRGSRQSCKAHSRRRFTGVQT